MVEDGLGWTQWIAALAAVLFGLERFLPMVVMSAGAGGRARIEGRTLDVLRRWQIRVLTSAALRQARRGCGTRRAVMSTQSKGS